MKRLPIISRMFLVLFCLSFILSAQNAGSTVGDVLNIPWVEYAPDIDGVLDEDWTWQNVQMFGYILENDTAYKGYTDFSSYYKAAWNEDGFYFYGEVTDDSIYTGDENSYANDCWEIYFDGGNEKSGDYDGNDVQWRWVYGTTEKEPGVADAGNWAWAETDNGYAFELEIPVAELVKEGVQLFPLEEGHVIGFEAQVAENDGAGREAMTKWWSESNDSWMNSGLFGTAVLSLTSGIAEPEVASNIDLSVAPVITSSAIVSVNVPAGVDAKVSLYNITGQKVKDLAVEGGKASLNAASLPNGVYLCVLKAGDEVVSKKVSVIK